MAPPAAAAKKARAAADAAEAAFHLAAYLAGNQATLDWSALAALGQPKPPVIAGAARFQFCLPACLPAWLGCV